MTFTAYQRNFNNFLEKYFNLLNAEQEDIIDINNWFAENDPQNNYGRENRISDAKRITSENTDILCKKYGISEGERTKAYGILKPYVKQFARAYEFKAQRTATNNQ